MGTNGELGWWNIGRWIRRKRPDRYRIRCRRAGKRRRLIPVDFELGSSGVGDARLPVTEAAQHSGARVGTHVERPTAGVYGAQNPPAATSGADGSLPRKQPVG